MLAAIAGSLYAFYTGYIEPNYLSINQSLDIIAMVLLGGRSSIMGPIAGAFVLTGLPHVINLSGEARAILYGLVLILTILVLPQGVSGALAGGRRAALGNYADEVLRRADGCVQCLDLDRGRGNRRDFSAERVG